MYEKNLNFRSDDEPGLTSVENTNRSWPGFVPGLVVGVAFTTFFVLLDFPSAGFGIHTRQAAMTPPSTTTPTVTINKNIATVTCPLSPDLMNPVSTVLDITTYAAAKNEIEAHGCPLTKMYSGDCNAVGSPCSKHFPLITYFVSHGCDVTTEKVTLQFLYQTPPDSVATFVINADDSMSCTIYTALWDRTQACYKSFWGAWKLLRKPAQLPYIRSIADETLSGQLQALVHVNNVCPGMVLISTDGTEQFEMEAFVCSWNTANGLNAARTIFRGTDDVTATIMTSISPGAVHANRLLINKAGHNLDIRNNNMKTAAELNAFGIPFSGSFTFNKDHVKFVY